MNNTSVFYKMAADILKNNKQSNRIRIKNFSNLQKTLFQILKEAIKEIDENAFIVVSDCYEVHGGTKRKSAVDL